MSRIIYKSHRTEVRGKGKKARLSVTAKFHDTARPDVAVIYNLTAINNAIADRQAKGMETKGLEYGRNQVIEEYKKRGLTPIESRRKKRHRQNDLT
jgi:hypothetical protein